MSERSKRMAFFEENGLRYYQFESFKDLPVFHAVLTRKGGTSQPPFDSLNTGGTVGDDPKHVLENHYRIFNSFGYNFDSRFDVWQVHGNKVVCTKQPRPFEQPHSRADGILTSKPEVTLFMRFADCVPILLVDPNKKAIGIVHAGWQGTYKRIVQRAIVQMGECFGSTPSSIYAGIGPSICQRCYEVGFEVYDHFSNSFKDTRDRYFKFQNGRYFLDLWQANKDILEESGVENIELSYLCTACNLDDWYSHRAENGKTGRFGVLMRIKKR